MEVGQQVVWEFTVSALFSVSVGAIALSVFLPPSRVKCIPGVVKMIS